MKPVDQYITSANLLIEKKRLKTEKPSKEFRLSFPPETVLIGAISDGKHLASPNYFSVISRLLSMGKNILFLTPKENRASAFFKKIDDSGFSEQVIYVEHLSKLDMVEILDAYIDMEPGEWSHIIRTYSDKTNSYIFEEKSQKETLPYLEHTEKNLRTWLGQDKKHQYQYSRLLDIEIGQLMDQSFSLIEAIHQYHIKNGASPETFKKLKDQLSEVYERNEYYFCVFQARVHDPQYSASLNKIYRELVKLRNDFTHDVDFKKQHDKNDFISAISS